MNETKMNIVPSAYHLRTANLRVMDRIVLEANRNTFKRISIYSQGNLIHFSEVNLCVGGKPRELYSLKFNYSL